MTAQVLLTGNQFLKQVRVHGFNEPMHALPVVMISQDNKFGIRISLFHQGRPDTPATEFFWGITAPGSLIAWWRAMSILAELDTLEETSIELAYCGGLRDPYEGEIPRREHVRAEIGADTHDAIMAQPIPEDVINVFLTLGQSEDLLISLSEILAEIRFGTASWDEKISDLLGTDDPQEFEEREAAVQAVWERYKGHLRDHAQHGRIPLEEIEYWTGYAFSAIQRGVEDKYGDDVVLAFAIVMGRAYLPISGAFPLSLIAEDADLLMQATIQDVSMWVAPRFTKGWVGFKRQRRSYEEYHRILTQLVAEWRETMSPYKENKQKRGM